MKHMPTPRWSVNLTPKERLVSELTELDREFAEANAGKLVLLPAQRKRMEQRRRELKQQIREIESREFHQQARQPVTGMQARNGCELRRVTNCPTPGHVKVTRYIPIPVEDLTEAQQRLRNDMVAAKALNEGRQLYMSAK